MNLGYCRFIEFVHCSILEYGFILTTEFIKRLSQAQLCYPDFNAPAICDSVNAITYFTLIRLIF